jgi:hypothetical protein
MDIENINPGVQSDESHGNGHKKEAAPSKIPQFLNAGQLSGMVSTKVMDSALDVLSKPGDHPRQLEMRTIVPIKHTDGIVMAAVLSDELANCREFHDTDGAEQLLDYEALLVSIGGVGRIQVTEAITGERRHEEAKSGGFERMAWGGGKKGG